jgi:hypothetical protein
MVNAEDERCATTAWPCWRLHGMMNRVADISAGGVPCWPRPIRRARPCAAVFMKKQ